MTVEYLDNVGSWFFQALIVSSKLARMATSEEANHQNKPRTCHQFDSTFTIDVEGKGEFVTLAHLQPEYTVLLFGVHVFDSDLFGGTTRSSEGVVFPTGAGIGPFLRAPTIELSTAAFTVPDANGGRDWQAVSVAGAIDRTNPGDWPIAALAQPSVASVDNFKAGMIIQIRAAGFDGVAGVAPAANRNYYVFWHALGPVAAYN